MYSARDMAECVRLVARSPAMLFGIEELLIANQDSGPAGVDVLRSYIRVLDGDSQETVSIPPPIVQSSVNLLSGMGGSSLGMNEMNILNPMKNGLQSWRKGSERPLPNFHDQPYDHHGVRVDDSLLVAAQDASPDDQYSVEDSVRKALAAVASHFSVEGANSASATNALASVTQDGGHLLNENPIQNLVNTMTLHMSKTSHSDLSSFYNPDQALRGIAPRGVMMAKDDLRISNSESYNDPATRALATTTNGSNTGYRGISWQESRYSYQACVYILGKQIYKIFSARKCGREKALESALEWLGTMRTKRDRGESLDQMMSEGLFGRKPSNTGIRGITWQESRMKFQCSIYMDKGRRVQKYFPTGLNSTGPRYEKAFREAQDWMKKMEHEKLMMNTYDKDSSTHSKQHIQQASAANTAMVASLILPSDMSVGMNSHLPACFGLRQPANHQIIHPVPPPIHPEEEKGII